MSIPSTPPFIMSFSSQLDNLAGIPIFLMSLFKIHKMQIQDRFRMMKELEGTRSLSQNTSSIVYIHVKTGR